MKITEKQILDILEATNKDLIATKLTLETLTEDVNYLLLETIECELENRGL